MKVFKSYTFLRDFLITTKPRNLSTEPNVYKRMVTTVKYMIDVDFQFVCAQISHSNQNFFL